jgi:hypothetical protein
MPIRGWRNPFPEKSKPKGVALTSGPKPTKPAAGDPGTAKAATEAMQGGRKSGSGDTGASASSVRSAAMSSDRRNGHGGSAGGRSQPSDQNSRGKGGGGGASASAVRSHAMSSSRKSGAGRGRRV